MLPGNSGGVKGVKGVKGIKGCVIYILSLGGGGDQN